MQQLLIKIYKLYYGVGWGKVRQGGVGLGGAGLGRAGLGVAGCDMADYDYQRLLIFLKSIITVTTG